MLVVVVEWRTRGKYAGVNSLFDDDHSQARFI